MRLLSFLNSIENCLHAGEPAPKGGVWENTRTVNFHLGLARLSLGHRRGENSVSPAGIIVIQSFALADGTPSLRATLSWSGQSTGQDVVHAIYAKNGTDWKGASGRIANAWLAGPSMQNAERKIETVEAAEESERQLAVAG